MATNTDTDTDTDIDTVTDTTWANADPAELKKFDALAAQWWDENGPCKPLHQINPLRIGYIAQHTPLAGKTVLDVGCGGGILAEAMAVDGARVTGIDLSSAAIQVAQLHARQHHLNIDYQCIDAESLAAGSTHDVQNSQCTQWDLITCMELLEHVPDAKRLVRALGALVKPGGSVYFSTIHRHPQAFLFAIVAAEYVLNLVPRGTHQYERFIPPHELAAWATAANLNTEHLIGLHYQPLTQTYRLGAGVNVNYLLRCQKPK